jgi:hypothetical protein
MNRARFSFGVLVNNRFADSSLALQFAQGIKHVFRSI